MMRPVRYDFGSNPPNDADSWVCLDESGYRTSRGRSTRPAMTASGTPTWAEDLLTVARAVALVDRRCLRKKAGIDGWTREIELRVQVQDADAWNDASPGLSRLLSILSFDLWRVTVRPGGPPLDAAPRLFGSTPPDAIALFSGGLDSTAYAAHHLHERGGRLMLISHDQAGAGQTQQKILSHLRGAFEKKNIDQYSMGDQIRLAGSRSEPSTRTRGFGYIASAVLVAAAHGLNRIVVPENGQLAINPPLSKARLGACSTRSVHPLVIESVNELIRAIGGDVAVENPFLNETKGDVCRIGREAGLSRKALADTVSCGSHSAQRKAGNCGFCYPCLVRRSGMRAGLGEDPTDYASELRRLSGPKQVQHVQDVQRWLARAFSRQDLLADLPLPRQVSADDVLSVIERGREELRMMVAAELST